MLPNNRHDYTKGNINRNLFLLALPMTLEMVLQATFNIFDMFFVGKLGSEAVSAVTMAGILVMVVFALSQGIAMGSGAMVARRIGEKDIARANVTVLQALFVAGTASVIIGIIGFINAEFFLGLIGASAEVIKVGLGYMRITFLCSFSIIFLFVTNAIFRGAGEAKAAMYLLGLANVLNIILDPLLIFGIGPFPELGVDGAAYATVISRMVTIVLQIILLLRGYLIVHLKGVKLKPDWGIIKVIVLIAIPGSMILFLRAFSLVILTRIVALYGTLIVAAYGIGIRVYQLVLFPGFGLGNAASTLVGQNLGAKNPRRAELSAWLAGGYNAIIMGAAGIFFYLYAKPIMGLFTNEIEVINAGESFIQTLSHSYVFLGLALVIGRSFIGAGDAISPVLINFFTLWVFQLPLAYFLAIKLDMREQGVWLTMMSTTILNTILFSLWFKVGRWKKKKI